MLWGAPSSPMVWPRRHHGVYHALPKGMKGTRSMMAVPPHHAPVDYTGLAATAWDLFSTDEVGPDDAFLRAIVAQYGEPALDIGCGSGRLLLPMLGEGVDIDGVEPSPDMLAICRERAAESGL